MTEDDFADLMAEPAGGHNHGWHRNTNGSWSALDAVEDLTHRQVFVDTPRVHGFAYGYVKLVCRCVQCRAWKTVYDADKRESRTRDQRERRNQ